MKNACIAGYPGSEYERRGDLGVFASLCFVLEIWIKQDKNSSVQTSSFIRMVDKKERIFLISA